MKKPAVFLDLEAALAAAEQDPRRSAPIAFSGDDLAALGRLGEQFALFVMKSAAGGAEGRRARALEALAETLRDPLITGTDAAVREISVGEKMQETSGSMAAELDLKSFVRAATDQGVDLGRSFVVGRGRTLAALAAGTGARGIHLGPSGDERQPELHDEPCAESRDEFSEAARSLEDAAEAILCMRGAEILRCGGLVAFPTETVYGLGADAGNDPALARLFAVKGRPIGHPVIVHLADGACLSGWSEEMPPLARRLAERFWPGPLTLILRRASHVSPLVTGGQGTVGLRVPAHPTARRLLRHFQGGIAAPSANRFGRVSPTTAEHVRQDLHGDVDLVLDGGPCAVGVESTIVDVSAGPPVMLRPGGVSREEIEEAVGCRIPVARTATRAPGTLESHYAPRARVIIVPAGEIDLLSVQWRERGARVESIDRPGAGELYRLLREADGRGAEIILVVLPEEEGLGLAVADRLRRAAGCPRLREPSPRGE